MECVAYSQTGEYHASLGLPNEDYITMMQKDKLGVIAASDGAGCAPQGGIAAMLAAEAMTRMLSTDFLGLYYSDGESARRKVTQLIQHSFLEYSHKVGIDPKDLACTIMAAAVDFEGRCVCFHLGDGIILREREGDATPGVVSSPRNGLTPNTTYLTMNCEMWFNLQYYRWKDSKLKSILLLTDGSAEHLVKHSGSRGWAFNKSCDLKLPTLKAFLDKEKPQDDYTCGLIHRNKTCTFEENVL